MKHAADAPSRIGARALKLLEMMRERVNPKETLEVIPAR